MRLLYKFLLANYFLGVGLLCPLASLRAQMVDDASESLSNPKEQFHSSTPSLHSRPIISDFNLLLNGSVGYLPLIDSSSLTSGFSKAYWIESSAKIFQLPFNFNYSSSSSFSVNPQTFTYHQAHLSFDCEQFLESIKQEMIVQATKKLEDQKQKLLQWHASDSIKKYLQLRDTFANPTYQLQVSQWRDSLNELMDSLDHQKSFDTTHLRALETKLSWYEKYQRAFEKLMRFQEQFSEIQNQFTRDSLLAKQTISKIQGITSREELLNQTSGLEGGLEKKLWALNFRQASIGTQLLENSPLTFHDYFSKGLAITYNNDNYILKTAVVKNNFGFSSFPSTNDSVILPENANQNVFLLGIGKGKLDDSYSLLTVSFIKNGQVTGLAANPNNKWLATYLQRFSIGKQLSLQYELGKTMMSNAQESEQRSNIANIVRKSAGITTLNYEIKKTKTALLFESSYIGEAYFTGGNPLLQPGTVNVAGGLKQDLFHSALHLDYEINVAHFITTTSSKSRSWYQLAQISYRLGKFGLVSCTVSPYQFNYYLPQANSSSISNSNFINLNLALNIPIGKQLINGNMNFSNYAYQSSLSDTAFSNSTRHLTSYLQTSIHKRQITFLGSYFIPTHDETSLNFINSMELTGTVIQSKVISVSVGPKWLGYQTYSDQAGGTTQIHAFLGKHFVLNTTFEKYFNIERDTPAYSSTVLFTTDLTFKL